MPGKSKSRCAKCGSIFTPSKITKSSFFWISRIFLSIARATALLTVFSNCPNAHGAKCSRGDMFFQYAFSFWFKKKSTHRRVRGSFLMPLLSVSMSIWMLFVFFATFFARRLLPDAGMPLMNTYFIKSCPHFISLHLLNSKILYSNHPLICRNKICHGCYTNEKIFQIKNPTL